MDIPFNDPENIEDPAIREILGQYKKAVDADDIIGQGESLLHLGTLYAIREQFPTAIKYYKQALSVQKESGDVHGQSKALSNIGLAHADLGHYNKAVKYHLRALDISREHSDRVAETNHLSNLAETYELLKQYDKAIECLQDVQLIYEDMDVPHLLRKAQSNLERLEDLQKDTYQAETIPTKRSTATLPSLPSSLQLESSTPAPDPKNESDEGKELEIDTSVTMFKLPNDALKAIQDAVKASQEMKNPKQEQETDKSSAEEDLIEAEVTAIIPNIDDEVLFETAGGQNVEDTGKIEAPQFVSDEEEDDTEEIMENPDLSTNVRMNFIRQAIKDNQYELSIAEAIGDIGKKGDYLMRLATLYMKLHQYDNAIHNYEQAIVLFGVLGKNYFREEAERGILEAREQKWSRD